MTVFRSAFFAVSLLSAAAAQAQHRDDPAQLVDAYITAQRTFDQTTLASITAPDFVEISPIGEVDPRAKMLSYYPPGGKQGPELTFTERDVRRKGDMAIITGRLAFAERGMRAVYVARHDARGWALVSVQYTPIRTPAPR